MYIYMSRSVLFILSLPLPPPLSPPPPPPPPGSLLTFLVDSKPAFEIPLEEVSRVTAGKNEVSLEFHQNDTAAVSLMEMRFHVPTTGTDSEEDPVQVRGGEGEGEY